MTSIVAEMPAIEELFDTRLLDPEAAGSLLDQARGLLLAREAADRPDHGRLRSAPAFTGVRSIEKL